MPLSKERDKVRKRRERAKSRLDKRLCPSAGLKPVQPNWGLGAPPQVITLSDEAFDRFARACMPDIDADGNVIPEY